MAITTSKEYEYSKEEFVDFVLKENPWLASLGSLPYEIYEFGKEEYAIDSPENKGRIEPWEMKEPVPKFDTSPGWFKSLASYGVDDTSANWRKASLANSLTGLTMQLGEGKLPFEITPEIENLAWWEEALAGAASMIYPLDVLSLGVGGVAGLGVKAGLQKAGVNTFARNNIKKGLVEGIAEKYGVSASKAGSILGRTIDSTASLAVFEGAKGNLSARVNGVFDEELGEYRDATEEELLSETMHGVVHGSLIGAALGGFGGWMGRANKELSLAHVLKRKGGIKGIGDAKAKELKKLINWDKYKSMPLKEIEKQLSYTGKFPQFMTEMGVFTASTQVDRALQGEELTWETLARDIGVNAGFLGVMKGTSKALGEGWRGAKDVVKEYKTYHEIEKIKASKELETLNLSLIHISEPTRPY